MFLPLDGPTAQAAISVGTGAVVEAKVGGSRLTESKVVTIQPIGGNVYFYLNDGSTPSAATVTANGFLIYRSGKESYEMSETQKGWLVSASGTINVIVAERA